MPDIGATHLLVGGDFLCVVDAQGAAWGFKRAPKTAPAKPSWHRDVAPGCRQAVATDLYLYTGNECLETATGRLQWRLKTHVLRDVHVALLGEHIVLTGVTTRGAPARQVLLLVKRGSGEIAWEKTLAEVASRDEVLTPPPTVARGTVFCGSADGVLRAFRLSDGAELWRYQTGPSLLPLGADERRNAPRISSQAVVSGRWVIVAGYDGRLVVLNRKTGKLRWQTPLGLPVAASPAVSGNALCLVDCDGNVFTFVGAAGRR